MSSELFDALTDLEREKGIPKEYMFERVEAALVSAYKRDKDGNSNVKVVINAEKKTIKMYQLLDIVETVEDPNTQISLEDAKKESKKSAVGGVCEVELKPKEFRRLSAQTGKQVIIQGIREAERGMMVKEYESKKEEVISARVQRVDPLTGNAQLDTGTSVVTLMKNEQIPGERLVEDQFVKVFVLEVKKESHGPIVALSRTHPGLVKRLFELEIPEIQDGTVIIKGITREAGSRTKMSVQSRDGNVDAVGTCIGNKGMRINQIVEELNGEKIDIIKYSDEPEEYIASALSPATVRQVILDGERSCKVLVNPDQFSLAIGKEGQNARLAAKLTGYKIDIKTEL